MERPDIFAADWLQSADKQHAAGDFAAAIPLYREATERDSTLFEAWYGLGCALNSIGACAEAITALRQALSLVPTAFPARATLAEAMFALGHVSASNVEYLRIATQGDAPLRQLALANIACSAPNDPAMDNAAILDARRRWIAAEAVLVHPIFAPKRPSDGKIRVGYLGAFFGSANWMKGYMGAINAHDRQRFEIHFLADRAVPVAASGYRDHDDDRIWDITGVPNEKLAGYVAQAGLDVLVDLNGYSFQRRLPLMLYRAAPVQLSWIGMYGTTGITGLDGVIGDGTVLPQAEEAFHAEPVLWMLPSYLSFDMFYNMPDVVPPPCLATGHVTFGSLVSAYKITDTVIASWSRVLIGVPGSRLLLRNKSLDHAGNRDELAARFAAHGISTDRLILEGGAPHDAFLRTYDRIDIALDAFPYNGGTTTAEAIWQGVPLLTFNGDRWASRTSASILQAAGLNGFVAADREGFVTLAVHMGLAPDSLVAPRLIQRGRIAATPAFDPVRACRTLEGLYAAALAGKV